MPAFSSGWRPTCAAVVDPERLATPGDERDGRLVVGDEVEEADGAPGEGDRVVEDAFVQFVIAELRRLRVQAQEQPRLVGLAPEPLLLQRLRLDLGGDIAADGDDQMALGRRDAPLDQPIRPVAVSLAVGEVRDGVALRQLREAGKRPRAVVGVDKVDEWPAFQFGHGIAERGLPGGVDAQQDAVRVADAEDVPGQREQRSTRSACRASSASARRRRSETAPRLAKVSSSSRGGSGVPAFRTMTEVPYKAPSDDVGEADVPVDPEEPAHGSVDGGRDGAEAGLGERRHRRVRAGQDRLVVIVADRRTRPCQASREGRRERLDHAGLELDRARRQHAVVGFVLAEGDGDGPRHLAEPDPQELAQVRVARQGGEVHGEGAEVDEPARPFRERVLGEAAVGDIADDVHGADDRSSIAEEGVGGHLEPVVAEGELEALPVTGAQHLLVRAPLEEGARAVHELVALLAGDLVRTAAQELQHAAVAADDRAVAVQQAHHVVHGVEGRGPAGGGLAEPRCRASPPGARPYPRQRAATCQPQTVLNTFVVAAAHERSPLPAALR